MVDKRQNAVQHAAALLKVGCVILDLETTGLSDDPTVDVVEIAALDHTGRVLINTRVQPERPIPPEATAVHGITDADVADAPRFEAVDAQLAGVVNGVVVVAYNAPFERAVLDTVCVRLGLPPLAPDVWHCAMQAYADFRRSRRWFKLTAACRAEGITVEYAHSAIGDCRLTLALLQIMAAAANPDA
ncbi:MAG: 3'-5' exonuclease [Anaerolineae bacterium]|nr:3'-5' exonuclease [Anaerolineae bacterium]